MARVTKKQDDLSAKFSQYRLLMWIGFIISGISFLVITATMRQFSFPSPILYVGFLGGFFLGGVMSHKAASYKSGIQGEATTAGIVRGLPDEYFGIQNMQIRYDGQSSELDMVVVGPTGVFIIETKNLNGTIVGNYDTTHWTQRKVGQQGTPYSKNFYSPVKQVGTHVYRLAHLLRDSGIRVTVESLVYFSNPDTVVQLVGTPARIPVFSALGNGESEIRRYLMNRPVVLSQQQISQIEQFLNQLQ